MVGKEVFKHAVEKLCSSFEEALLLCNKNIADIDWFVPHQANQRILSAVLDRLKIDKSKVISTVAYHGNTSAASIPLALCIAIEENKINDGDLVMMVGTGAGLSVASSIFKF